MYGRVVRASRRTGEASPMPMLLSLLPMRRPVIALMLPVITTRPISWRCPVVGRELALIAMLPF